MGELTEALGRDVVLRQGNHARSSPGVARGFHPEPWDRLVHVVRGTTMAATLDQRPGSSTFGELATFHLGDPPADRIRLFMSAGLGNAYCTYGAVDADYLYDVSEEYRSVDKMAVAFDDPDLGVDWPVTDLIVSHADRGNPRLRDRLPEHPRLRDRFPEHPRFR